MMEVEAQQTNGKQEEEDLDSLSPELQEAVQSNHEPVSLVVEIKTNGCLDAPSVVPDCTSASASAPPPCLGPLSAEQLSAVLHATMPASVISEPPRPCRDPATPTPTPASVISEPPRPSKSPATPTTPASVSSEPPWLSRGPATPTPTPATLERLQVELRGLRDEMDMMKSQHNKEIKLLMNELDEEKRIRLTLQMEMQRMNKRISKMS